MKRGTKIIILLVCVSLCGGGIILSARENKKENNPKSEVAPVINRSVPPKIWLRA